jgi:phage-related protein
VYYHCTIVADERDNHLADAALDICKQAIENPRPEPYKK